MHSIKPGRGPSFGGIFGGIFAGIFGIFFATTAMSNGAPAIFGVFGAFFAIAGFGGAVISAINAFGKNRFSTYDITSDNEESDPFVEALGGRLRSGSQVTIEDVDGSEKGKGRKFEGQYCPYCGAEAEKDFNFCPKCGKDI